MQPESGPIKWTTCWSGPSA